SVMTEIYCRYQNPPQVKTLSTSPSPDLQNTSFHGYSFLYCGVRSNRDFSDCTKSLALKLLDCNNHTSTMAPLKAHKPHCCAVDLNKYPSSVAYTVRPSSGSLNL